MKTVLTVLFGHSRLFCSVLMIYGFLLAYPAAADNKEPRILEWEYLVPPEELLVLKNMPDSVRQVQDGSEDDKISSRIQSGIAAPTNDYERALVSTNGVKKLDGQSIRIPGFMVPLDFTESGKIVSFFLVPYFGACMHLPLSLIHI